MKKRSVIKLYLHNVYRGACEAPKCLVMVVRFKILEGCCRDVLGKRSRTKWIVA